MFRFVSYLVLVIWAIGTASFADVFTFKLRGYPKKERNCHAQTEAIAEEFEKGTQLKALHVECVAQKQTGYDFSIEYESPQKLNLVSTEYELSFTYSTGRYREQNECLTQLPIQTQLFEQATRLKPFFTYCRSLELGAGKNWEIILIAQGQTELRPEMGGVLMFARPTQYDLNEYRNSLARALERKGALLADLIFHYNAVMGTGGASIHYFASQRIDFNLERLSQVPSLDQCLLQLGEVKRFLEPISGNLFAVYCGEQNLGYHDLHFGFLDKASFKWFYSVDSFTSFRDCENNRSEVLKHYEGSATEKLLGGICSRNYETNRYQVVLFRSRQS